SFDRKDYDLTTYAGALEELFHFTYSKFPQAKVGYIINFATPLATGIGHVTNMEEYYAEGIKICQKWGVHYLDLYHDKTVNQTVMEVDKQPFCYMADAVHPNAAGYERLSPLIGDWMETLTDNQKPQKLTDTRSFVKVCKCDDLALWRGTDNTELTACQTPDGTPAVQLFGKSQNQNHIRGMQWLGARAECELPQSVNLSDCALLRLRFYISHDFFGQAGQLLVEFLEDENNYFRMFFGFDGFPRGWHEMTFNLNDRRFYHGEPKLTNISRVRISWFNHNNCMEDFVLAIADIHGQQ
ncbi:MAG: SGNH/GDSL hydrolase family protein, partial [Clostridia bacterium]|nr:SGNH/GDSL hydrolase family protein [Clostridia bacterium]